MFSIQPANSADFAAILELQERNHLSTLDEDARGDGFLTTYLDPQNLEFLRAQSGLVLAKSGGELAGFACGTIWDPSSQSEFQRAVLQLFPLAFESFQITAHNSFQYGPACVAAHFRGLGVLGALAENLKASFRARCDFGITFIDHRNARSLAAHTRKLGFGIVAELPFGGTIYHVLGFSTRSSI